MPSFSNIDGEESATVTFTVAAISLTRNSSAELQELLSIADSDISTAIARVTNAPPDSTNGGLNVRVLSGPSSVADLSVRPIAPSTYGEGGLYRVAQSTAGDLQVTVGNFSTTVNVSSVGGAVVVRSSAANFLASVYQSTAADLNATITGTVGQASTVWPVQLPSSQSFQVKNSTIGDLLASVQQNSTTWQVQAKIQDSSGVGFLGTTTRPTTAAQGLVVRECLNNLQSTGHSTAGATSTRTELVSSVASQRHKVYAYSITSTVVIASTVFFASSNAQKIWPIVLGSGSSGITGANVAVGPPGWLFATEAGAALNFITPSSGPEFVVSVSYFTEA